MSAKKDSKVIANELNNLSSTKKLDQMTL